MIDEILQIIDTKTDDAFLQCYQIKWTDNRKCQFDSLMNEWINTPIGFDKTTFRSRLKALLLALKADNPVLSESYSHVSKILLSQDFLPQKERFNNKAVKQANFIVLQGTPTCGLQYFIAHQHNLKKPALVNCIKADTIQLNENNFCEVIWNAIGSKLGIEFDETSEIRTHLKEKLKEQSIAMVFYDVQNWTDLGSDFLQKLKSVADFWKETKHEIKPFYCYFVYLNLPELTDDKESDVIILPLVEWLKDDELRQLRANHDDLFCNCPIDIQQALSGNLKLHDVIEIFCKHSTCSAELSTYFEQYRYFS